MKKIISLVLVLLIAISALSMIPFSAAEIEVAEEGATYGLEINSFDVVDENIIQINWDKVNGADYYVISYNDGTTFLPKYIKTVPANEFDEDEFCSTTIPDVVYDTDYIFYVAPFKHYHHADVQLLLAIGKHIIIEEPTTVTDVTNDVNALKVEWDAVPNAVSYVVYYADTTNPDEEPVWNEYTIVDAEETSVLVTDLTSGNNYSFFVKAIDEDGNSMSLNSESSAPVTYYDTPEITSFSRYTMGDTIITWTAVEGAKGYKLYYRRDDWDDTEPFKAFATTDAETTSYHDYNLKYDRSYHYAVVATDEEGNDLTLFDAENAKWIHRYNIPKLTLTLSHTQSNVILNWDPIEQAVELGDTPVSYAVYYRRADWTDKNAWKLIGVTEDTTFEDTGCVTGYTYQYAVQVYDVENSVTLSSYETKSITYCKIPYDLAVVPQADKTKVTISWHGILNVKNYNVYYKRDDFTGWKLLKSCVQGNSTTDSNLKPGHTYTYTVRCADSKGTPISSYDLEGASYECPLD